MKILYRIMDVLAHPSRIAMYFKDKIYTVLIHLLVAAGLCIGAIALLAFNQNYFTRGFADDFIPLVQQESSSYDNVFQDDVLTGTKQKFEYGNFVVYISNSKYKNDDEGKYVLVFGEKSVTGYYNQNVKFTKNYTDFELRYNFTLEGVRTGDNESQVAFADMLAETYENFEGVYALNIFVYEVEMLGIFTAIVFVVMMIYSFLINPTIKAPVRLKLISYDSIIFFFAYTMYEIIGAGFIQYIAFGIPLFYCGITFRHIIRLNRKGVN